MSRLRRPLPEPPPADGVGSARASWTGVVALRAPPQAKFKSAKLGPALQEVLMSPKTAAPPLTMRRLRRPLLDPLSPDGVDGQLDGCRCTDPDGLGGVDEPAGRRCDMLCSVNSRSMLSSPAPPSVRAAGGRTCTSVSSKWR